MSPFRWVERDAAGNEVRQPREALGASHVPVPPGRVARSAHRAFLGALGALGVVHTVRRYLREAGKAYGRTGTG